MQPEAREGESMSESMVERVKAALREHMKCDATGLSPAVASVFLTGFDEAAHAAIAAMREPTDEMAEAGFQHTADPCWQENVKEAWRAMIDQILSEHPGEAK